MAVREPMTNEPLHRVGEDTTARARIIAALQEFERLPQNRFTTVRDDVTGPIVDALHASIPIVRKELSNGLVFEFLYRSKIARDFVMSRPEKPDHVWEPQTTKLLLHLAGTVTDVIVGGAYFGDQAIPIANALRERGTCHAFEADAVQASMIERNASINNLDNVRVNALGLWSQPATLRLVGHDALAGAAESETGIAATTIDAYARGLGIRIGLIMLDLEGGELHALHGASEQLARNAPYVVFEVHRSYVDWSRGLHNTEIVQFLSSLGYSILAIRDFQSNYDLAGRPVELVPIETAYLDGPPHGFNLFAFRDRAVLENELFRIVPNVSPKLLFHRDPKLHHPTGGL
jgi:FkbM family methyltransferase